jgi:peptide deformylase
MPFTKSSLVTHKSIIQNPHKTLRLSAKVLEKTDFESGLVKKVIQKMDEALDGTPDGIAIAAPQINESYRIFVISKQVLTLPDYKNIERYYVNPNIIKTSGSRNWKEEGCLSVRNIYGKVHRYKKVTLSYLDEYGNSKEKQASGLLAHIFQHETDHLNGILFCDSAIEMHEIED